MLAGVQSLMGVWAPPLERSFLSSLSYVGEAHVLTSLISCIIYGFEIYDAIRQIIAMKLFLQMDITTCKYVIVFKLINK